MPSIENVHEALEEQRSVLVRDSLVEVGHGDPPLGLLHHVGLAPQTDADHGGGQFAGLSVDLHRDGLERRQRHLFALMEALAVTSDLQRRLDTTPLADYTGLNFILR